LPVPGVSKFGLALTILQEDAAKRLGGDGDLGSEERNDWEANLNKNE
jgi:hypothetical protein